MSSLELIISFLFLFSCFGLFLGVLGESEEHISDLAGVLKAKKESLVCSMIAESYFSNSARIVLDENCFFEKGRVIYITY